MSPSDSQRVRNADRIIAWTSSGGLCNFPDCGESCTREATDADPSALIGELGHIEGSSNRGPRANPSLTNRERHSHHNLILLCATHHELVDSQPNTYTVDILRQWKADSEARYHNFLVQNIGEVTFAELSVITDSLVTGSETASDTISVIPPQAKIDRNGLSITTGGFISMGLAQVPVVEQFVKRMGAIDVSFISRLTSGFVTEYQRQVGDGFEGDALFATMWEFSYRGRGSDPRYVCAGLTVLTYMFERCEVFEH